MLDHDVVCPNTVAGGPHTRSVPTPAHICRPSLRVTQLQAERCVPASTKNTIVEFEECKK